MFVATCKLCLYERPLRKSHVIPNATFRALKRRYSGKGVTFSDAQYSWVTHSIESWWEHLLCEDCERLISRSEKPLIEMLRGRPKGMGVQTTHGMTFSGFDYSRAKLFFTSLLWRAHVASIEPYQKVSLPSNVAERARVSLLNDVPLNPMQLACCVSQLVDPNPDGFNSKQLSEFIASPFRRRAGRMISYVFTFEGYIAEFFVPKLPFTKREAPGLLKRRRIWAIPAQYVFEVEEILGLLVAGYAASVEGRSRLES